MISLTLKVILRVAENDSKYRDVAPLSVDGSLVHLCTQHSTRQIAVNPTNVELSCNMNISDSLEISFTPEQNFERTV